MTKLKQFNFKIPQELYDKLKAASDAKGVKMTDLVTQGIHQVLGITAKSSKFGVDLDIYQLIDQVNVRLDKLEKDHIDIAQNLYQYIPRLETQLKESTPATDNIQEIHQELLKGQELKHIVTDIVNELYHSYTEAKQQTPEEPPEETKDIQSIANGIAEEDSSITEPEPLSSVASKKEPLEGTQLEFVNLEDNEKNLPANAQKIDSTEISRILKQADPNQNWNSQLLTSYRRLKKYLDKWHQVGNYQFKYAGETKELGKTKHLWWIVSSDVAEDS